MATIDLSITVPDGSLQELIADYTAFHGYQAKILDEATGKLIDNPQTKRQFLKRQIVRTIKNDIRTYRARQAAQLATNLDAVDIN